MYNAYKCPLQPCRHLTLKLLIQGHPWSAKVPHIADLKSVYISLIIGPRGLQYETNLLEIMGWESLALRIAKLRSAYNSPIIGPTGLQCETNL